ncbi:MAG: hypothetical protein HYZ14_08740 [Bacteroidetes bacterium]|nr:hypothetical protein [Bacteroidota bacterium]
MKRKILKWTLLVFILGAIAAVSIFLYYWYMPHRDIQSLPVDIEITSEDLVSEYLSDPAAANQKYLQEEGDSKIIAVTGNVFSVEKDMNNQYVVYLKEPESEVGVRCTFMTSTNENAASLKTGQDVTIKGVIRSGAEYDEDLDLYEDAIIEKCDILK